MKLRFCTAHIGRIGHNKLLSEVVLEDAQFHETEDEKKFADCGDIWTPPGRPGARSRRRVEALRQGAAPKPGYLTRAMTDGDLGVSGRIQSG